MMFRIFGFFLVALLMVAANSGKAIASSARLIAPFEAVNLAERQPAREVKLLETPVTVDAARLQAAKPGDSIALSPVDNGINVTVERVERRPSGHSIFGLVNHDPESAAVITTFGEATAGFIQQPHAGLTYRIRYAGNGVHTMAPVAGPTHDACGVDDAQDDKGHDHADVTNDATIDRSPIGASQPRGGCSAPRIRHEMLAYYTNAAATANGGNAGAVALIQLGVDLANLAYAASGIGPRLILLDAQNVGYTESNDLEQDRDALRDDNDGVMDFAHPDRDDFGADVVSLMVIESDPALAGIAFCTPNQSQGFCVFEEDDVDNGNQVVAHELGHLQGCAHNRGDAGFGCNEFCYSFGLQFVGTSGAGWRTIMAVLNPTFPNAVPRFSNVNQTWDGQSLGVDTFPCGVFPSNDDADNARSITDNADELEGFRETRFSVWADNTYSGPERGTFVEPHGTFLNGLDAVFDGNATPLVTPTLNLKASTYTATPTISKPMRIEACGGTARIGG